MVQYTDIDDFMTNTKVGDSFKSDELIDGSSVIYNLFTVTAISNTVIYGKAEIYVDGISTSKGKSVPFIKSR